MAEVAPLSTAHAHARKAAEETQQIHWVAAADEHQAAVTHYAKASKGTSDTEALRVLKLLEEQHQRLARIIKAQQAVDHAVDANIESPQRAEASANTKKPTSPTPSTGAPSSIVTNSPTSALAAVRMRRPPRDTSPSLARDIASRRGIPPQGRQTPSAAAQARARQLSPESHRRSSRTASGAGAPKIPPSVVSSQASLSRPTARKAKKAEDDEGFATFYNNLTTGTMSKLTSVLAFAGLPLTADDIPPEAQQGPRSKSTVRASHEVDVKKIYSPAALAAIEDDHRQRGTLGHGFGPAESFYVVPPTGMTTSYRDMATGRRGSSLGGGAGEDDEDDFVDAQEAPSSPRNSRINTTPRQPFGKNRTMEELELENQTQKTTIEFMAGRLAEFEIHSQDFRMAEVEQSMVLSHRPAAATAQPSNGGNTDTAMLERVRQLEQTVEKDAEERRRLEAVMAEQEKALKKWHARYAKLREGAKERQKVRNEKVGGGGKNEGEVDAAGEESTRNEAL